MTNNLTTRFVGLDVHKRQITACFVDAANAARNFSCEPYRASSVAASNGIVLPKREQYDGPDPRSRPQPRASQQKIPFAIAHRRC